MRRNMNAGLIGLGVLGLLAGAGALWVASTPAIQPSGIPSAPVALLVGWSFIGSGLLSWRARPDNRLGPVMVLSGFAWFASVLQEGHGAVLFTIGQAFQVLYLAGFLYLILSFPSGRLQTVLDRALVITAFALVSVGQLASLLFTDERAICDRCATNLLEVTRNDALANGLLQSQRIAGLVVIVITIGLLAVRLVRASRPQRRAVIPVLLAGIVALAALAVSVTASALGAAGQDIYGRVSGYAFAVVPVAVLIHDPALEHNAELVDSVCAAAGLTLENERLQAELRARLTELQASRARLVEATEAERRRIERDLHDGTQQRLVSIAMSLGLLESKLPGKPSQAQPIVRETRQALAAALDELRELTQGIHPTILAERGLPVALDELCHRAALPTHLQLDLSCRLPDQVESAAYFRGQRGAHQRNEALARQRGPG